MQIFWLNVNSWGRILFRYSTPTIDIEPQIKTTTKTRVFSISETLVFVGADEQIIFAIFTFNSKRCQISHFCPDIVGNIFFYQIIYYYLILLSYYFQVSFHTFHSFCPYILCTYTFDFFDDNQIYLHKYLL